MLGVARGEVAHGTFPPEHRSLAAEFLGLVAFEDPLRASVPAAVAECRTAGIRVVMITGDYPETARNIACQGGTVRSARCDYRADIAQHVRVRTGPTYPGHSGIRSRGAGAEIAHRQALKANGEIVAMTGDGVNTTHRR